LSRASVIPCAEKSAVPARLQTRQHGQKTNHDSGGHLVSGVREQARQAHTHDIVIEPAAGRGGNVPILVCLGLRIHLHTAVFSLLRIRGRGSRAAIVSLGCLLTILGRSMRSFFARGRTALGTSGPLQFSQIAHEVPRIGRRVRFCAGGKEIRKLCLRTQIRPQLELTT
jgi:hypothetical protein